jgi:hypothetical protein
MEYIYIVSNLKKNKLIFWKKIIISFVNMETDPRVRYLHFKHNPENWQLKYFHFKHNPEIGNLKYLGLNTTSEI